MSKSTFIRLSGWSLAVGAIAFMIVIVGTSRDVPEYNPYNYLSSPIDLYFEYAFTILMPTAMFLWLVGMVGLYFRYKNETSVLGKFSPILGIVGAGISLLVTLSWSLQLELTQSEADYWVFIGGLSLYFLALIFFGIASMRDHLLPRWNALPIIAGSWLILLWLLSIQEVGDVSDPFMLGVTFVSMLSLVALGATLKPDTQEETILA